MKLDSCFRFYLANLGKIVLGHPGIHSNRCFEKEEKYTKLPRHPVNIIQLKEIQYVRKSETPKESTSTKNA